MGTRTSILDLYRPDVGEVGWGGDDKVDGNWNQIDALFQGTGQLKPSAGGLGVDVSAAPNGALLIGNGTGLSLNVPTAGSGILITTGPGSLVISQSGAAGGGSLFATDALIGSGNGTDYTRTSNTFDDVDAVNLKATVTVPGAAKFLIVQATFSALINTATSQGYVRVLAAGMETALGMFAGANAGAVNGVTGGTFTVYGVLANPPTGSQTIALQFRGDGTNALTLYNPTVEGIHTSGSPNFISWQIVRPRLLYMVTN